MVAGRGEPERSRRARRACELHRQKAGLAAGLLAKRNERGLEDQRGQTSATLPDWTPRPLGVPGGLITALAVSMKRVIVAVMPQGSVSVDDARISLTVLAGSLVWPATSRT